MILPMTWKSTVVVSGAGLRATWLASYPPANAPQPAAAPAVPVATSGADIQEQAARLQAKVRSVVEYEEPSRNPFRFAPRRAPVPRESTSPDAPPASPSAPIQPAPVAITLTGVAIDVVGGQEQWTAILGTANGLAFAKVGEEVAGYRVAAISEEAVELVAADGARLVIR